MKKILFISILMLTDMVMAYNPPRGMADVLRRSMNSSGGSWLAKFGHVALYDASLKKVLEVTNHGGIIRWQATNTMMRNGYKGARYGKAYGWQAGQVLGAGLDQRGSGQQHAGHSKPDRLRHGYRHFRHLRCGRQTICHRDVIECLRCSHF